MKGLIAEIDGRNMIVITEKGDFVKVKRNIRYGIGDEIQLPVRSQKQLYKALSAVAASILICVMLGSGVYAYYTPYSYVSVDINPSLGLSLNRFDKVIDVQPLNEDARKLISTADPIKYEDIDDAMSEILESAAENGYLKPDQENGVMVVVSTAEKNEESKLTEQIKAISQKELSKVSKNYNVIMEKTSVSDYKAAMAQKTSPGKLKLAAKVKVADPTVTDAEVKDMSVRQVMQIIKEKSKAQKDADKAAKEELKQEHKSTQASVGKGTGAEKEGTASSIKGPGNSNGKAHINVKTTGNSESGKTVNKPEKPADNGKNKGQDKKKDEPVSGNQGNNGDNGKQDKGNASGDQDIKDKGDKQDNGGGHGGSKDDKGGNKDKPSGGNKK